MSHYCDRPRPCAMHGTNRGNYDVIAKAVTPTPKTYREMAAFADQDIMVKIPADLVPKLEEVAAGFREHWGVSKLDIENDLLFVHHIALRRGVEALPEKKP